MYSNWFDNVFYRNSKTKLLMKELEKNKRIDKTILINIYGNDLQKENGGHDHGKGKDTVEIMKAENTLQVIVKYCPGTDVKIDPETDVKSCTGTDKFKSEVLKTISNYIEDQFGPERLLELLKNPGEKLKCVLHEAAENKHTLCCSFLINKHGKELLEMKDKRGYTPLHYMVGGKFKNGLDKAFKLCSEEDRKFLLEQKDKSNDTPVHMAAKKGFDNILKSLLDNGAKSDSKNKHGYTPLHLAAQNGHEKCIDILLQTKKDESELETFVNDKGKQRITALMLAARHGFDNSCKKLIHYSDLNSLDKTGKTVLHYAAKSGGIRTFKLLFEEGAKNSTKSSPDKTLLFLAAKHEGIEILEYLFEQMKISLSEFADLLWITVNNKCNDTLKYLLRILENKNCFVKEEVTDGAIQNILKEPREGNTILHKVISKKWFTAATIIIKLCPELKFKRNKKGEYPLHLVSKISSNISGTDKVKKYEDLLTALAQGSHNIVNKFNPEGKSYPHLCAEFGNTSLISRLFKRGCDLTINNRQGESAIEIAAKFSNNDTLEEIMRLLDKGEKERLKGKLRKALKISAQKGNLEGVKILMSYLQVTTKDQILTN